MKLRVDSRGTVESAAGICSIMLCGHRRAALSEHRVLVLNLTFTDPGSAEVEPQARFD